MYQGWMQFGGTEIFNASRVYTYAKELAPGFQMLNCVDCDTLPMALGDGEYRLPHLDEPDWFDAANPDTWNFAGFFPLEVSGVENSNREVEILQSIRDGGIIGPVRLGTKDVRVRGMLIAGDPCSLQAGISWLKSVLNGNPCEDDCVGDELCYFNCCPPVVEGTTDPSAEGIPTELSLARSDWTISSGSWSNGRWSNPEELATAVGPTYEPPCDIAVVVANFLAISDQTVTLNIINSGGEIVVSSGEVVVRQTNYARNPMFRTNTVSWTPAANSTITKIVGEDAGRWQANAPFVAGNQLVRFLGGEYVLAGKTFSGRVTVTLEPALAADTCVRFELATLAGNTFFPVGGTDQVLSAGDTVELEVTGATITDPGQLFGMISACGPVATGTQLKITQAIITETDTQVPYFDGDSPDVLWVGTPNNAYSRMQNTEISITVPNGTGEFRPEIVVDKENDLALTELTAWARETVDPSVCAEKYYINQLKDVVVTAGPEIIQKIEECDHAIAEVEFVFTAANPYIWRTLPWDIDVTGTSSDSDVPPELSSQPNSTTIPSVTISAIDNCPTEADTLPLSDPNCPLPPAPPRPPMPDDCVETVLTYRRRGVTVAGGLFSPWEEAVPVIELKVNSSTAVRQARVRFYPNPLNRTAWNDIDLCSFCGEFIISYLPGNSTITIDGVSQRARVELSGNRIREASHLLYSSDGGPMIWPTLTCGTGYVVSVDVAPTNVQVVTSSLQLAVRS